MSDLKRLRQLLSSAEKSSLFEGLELATWLSSERRASTQERAQVMGLIDPLLQNEKEDLRQQVWHVACACVYLALVIALARRRRGSVSRHVHACVCVLVRACAHTCV